MIVRTIPTDFFFFKGDETRFAREYPPKRDAVLYCYAAPRQRVGGRVENRFPFERRRRLNSVRRAPGETAAAETNAPRPTHSIYTKHAVVRAAAGECRPDQSYSDGDATISVRSFEN